MLGIEETSMKTLKITEILTVGLLLNVSTTWAQDASRLTARELFYTAPGAKVKAETKPEPKPPTPVAKPPAKAPKTEVAKNTPPKPVKPAADRPAEPPAEITGGARLTNAAVSAGVPLGVRYSIVKYADDDALEVDPELVFRSGDKIKLRLQVNDEAYLYVVMQGSSGAWRVMFPSPDVESGSNKVVPGRLYDIPGHTRLVFDEQPGAEKVFIVLSRTPETQIDKLIYDLESGSRKAEQPKSDQSKSLMASAALSNSLVEQMRKGIAARDLVFEKVDDSKPAPKNAGVSKETAVYVVNASRAAESRLVADIQLKHR
jgi:hypothetical protein